MTEEMKTLKELVEAHYGTTPTLPKTSVMFRMKMRKAIELLQSNNVPLPIYEGFKAKRVMERNR